MSTASTAAVLFAVFAALSSGRHVERQPREAGRVCYERLECFSNAFPFNNTVELPQQPQFINTSFWLVTRRNPSTPQALIVGQRARLQQSSFDPSKKVKIIIHGFLQNHESPWVEKLTREFLRKEDVNVLAVDWGQGAGFPYSQAVANTRVAGAEVALLLVYLRQAVALHPRDVHLIGHSLGAHVAGYVGERVSGIARITGLDPAKPNYINTEKEVRLDSGDARFVDIIHTDGSPYETTGGYGMPTPMGHVDYYPNGGVHQPGCWGTSLMDLVRHVYSFGVQTTAYAMSCSHDRATDLFSESVNSECSFAAFPCQSMAEFRLGRCLQCQDGLCPSMGYSADQTSAQRGSFYLLTAGEQPFCGHHYFVAVQLSPHMTTTTGTVRVSLHGPSGKTDTLELQSSAYLEGGDEVKRLLFTTVALGGVTEVHVHFEGEGGVFWRNDEIQIEHVTVMEMATGITRAFCEGTRSLPSWDHAVFSTSAPSVGDCPHSA